MAENLSAAELRIVAKFVDEASAPMRALASEAQRLGSGPALSAITSIAPQAQTASAALAGVGKQGVFAFGELDKAAAPAAETISKLSKASKDVGSGLDKSFSGILLRSKTAGDALGLIARNLDLIGLRGPANLAAVSSSVTATGSTLGTLAAGVSALGVALVGVAIAGGAFLLFTKALVNAVSATADFNREFSRVNLLLNQSADENKKLRAEVYALSRTYNLEAKTAATAFYTAIEEGAKDAAEANRVVTTAAKVQAAGFADLNIAVAAVSDVIDAYGERAGTVEEVGNKLALISTRTATSFVSLGRGFGSVLPIASQLGVEFDELSSLLELLRTSGLKTPRAFATLSQSLAALADPKVQRELRANGVAISDLRIRAEGITPILVDINRAFDGNAAGLAKIAPALGGLDVLLGKVKNGADKLGPSLKALRTDKDFLDNSSAKRLASSFNTVDNAAKKLTSQFEEMFGPAVLNGAANFVNVLSSQKSLLAGIEAGAFLAASAIEKYINDAAKLAAVAGVAYEAQLKLLGLGSSQQGDGFIGPVAPKGFLDDKPEQPVKVAVEFDEAATERRRKTLRDFLGDLKAIEDAGGKIEKSIAPDIDRTSAAFVAMTDAARKAAEEASAFANSFDQVALRFDDQLRVTVKTDGFDAAIGKAQELAGLLDGYDPLRALSRASLELEGTLVNSFDGVKTFVEASEGEVKRFVGFVQDASGEIRAQFEKVNPRAIGPLITVSPFEFDDLQKSIDDALGDLGSIPVDVTLEVPSEAVAEAKRVLSEFRNSADFYNIELVSDSEKAKLAAALEIVGRLTEASKDANTLLGSLREAAADKADTRIASLNQKFDDLEQRVAALGRLGFKVAEFRTLLAQGRQKGLQTITSEIAAEAQKVAEAQALISQSQDDALTRIRSTFAGFDKQLLTGFAAERAALDQSIAAARAEFEKIANDPKSTAGTKSFALIAIEGLDEVRGKLSDALGIREETEKAEKLGDELSKLVGLRAETLSGGAGDLARLTAATNAQIAAEERRRDSATENVGLIDKQIEQLKKIGATQQAGLVFDATFRPVIDFDNDVLRAQIEENFKPQLEELNDYVNRFLSGDGVDSDGLREKFQEVTAQMRAARIEAQQSADRFNVGFSDGIAATIEEYTDQARIGFNLARDTADLLSDSISGLIQNLVKGKASFKDFFNVILEGFTKLIADILAKRLVAGIFSSIAGGIGGVTGGGEGGIFAQGGIMPGEMQSTRAFAQGGVMPGQMLGANAVDYSHNGATLPIRKYAMGGVATSPQQAIFAEKPGMAEAFVPLPGVGRGIPVEFKQQRAEAVNVNVYYTIHAMDGMSVEQMLETHGRKIGDIAAAQIATRSNRALVTSVRGAQR